MNDYVNFVYDMTVDRIVDGDSFFVTVELWSSIRKPPQDVGFGIMLHGRAWHALEVRLYGCDAPDLPNKARKDAATAYMKTLIQPGSMIRGQTFKPHVRNGMEKFGRWLAIAWLPDGRRLDDVMVAAGHAVPYTGGSRVAGDLCPTPTHLTLGQLVIPHVSVHEAP